MAATMDESYSEKELLTVSLEKKKFICVEYPGIVKNVENMLKTLRGESSVSKTYRCPSQRLELRWRPDDVYCNSCWAERNPSTSLLLKVKRRKRRDGSYEMNATVCGSVDITYKYQGMSDFQYLPMARTGENAYKSLREELIIEKVEHSSWFQKPGNLFLPPQFFARSDTSSQYMYRPDPKARGEPLQSKFGVKNTNLIGVARRRRPHFAQLIYFGDKVIPSAPSDGAIDNVRLTLRDKTDLAIGNIKAMFEKHPIWSKNKLSYEMGEDKTFLKTMLPLVAYFMCTGPWRMLWIKHGYDPRKNVEAKIYQTVDFRFRQRSSFDNLGIGHKRSAFYYMTPNVVHRGGSAPSIIQIGSAGQASQVDKHDDKDSECNAFRFKPDVIPPCRQIFYQICDVEIPELQELMHSNDGKETECTERDGWFIKDLQEKCRAQMYEIVEKLLPVDENDPGNIYNVNLRPNSKKRVFDNTKRKAPTPLVIQRRKKLGLHVSDSEDDEDDEIVVARELMIDD